MLRMRHGRLRVVMKGFVGAPLSVLLLSCHAIDSTIAAVAPVVPVTPPTSPFRATQTVATSFELLGGYRLQSDFASEGLALIRDADGIVVQAIAGANVQTASVNVYDLNVRFGAGTDATNYPVLAPIRKWAVAELFPRFPVGQNLRDVTVNSTSRGYEIAGIGRVYYNTSPRAFTQINVREMLNNGAVLGAAREIAVDLPEQEFSGFIKHDSSALDVREIGAGAYDSGQGSVAGLSYAIQQHSGSWQRALTPPGFGDLASPRLPRDAEYSCTDGASWVCLPPVGGHGVWSTERIGAGGVKYGNNLLFIAMLGYGERNYAKQTYTFGDPSLDKAVAYFFKSDPTTGKVEFQSYDRWVHANPGEPVVGVALGRVRGDPDLLLFVVKSMAWKTGAYQDGSVLQIFRINPR